MKGVVFNVFESFVDETFGEDAFDALVAQCPLHTREPFVGPGTYPDADLIALVTKACTVHGLEPEAALRVFGAYLFGALAARYPGFLEGKEAKTFLLSVHDVIHVEVRKLYPEAVTPSFTYEDTGPDTLTMRYTSERKLCHLMEGLLAGTAEHFGTSIDARQATCMHEGADVCTFHLRFGQAD